MRFLALSLALTCPFAAVACGGSQSRGTANAGSLSSGVDKTRCDESGKHLVTADTNHDEKPDVWKLYQTSNAGGQGVEILTCKQVDLNHDGRLDMVDRFDGQGQLQATEFDLDFDGRFDKTVFFQNGKKVRSEQVLGFDGKPNQFEYYEGDRLARVEIDTNSDGRIDVWQYYENGKLDRIGYDSTGSGRVDKWERAPEDAGGASEAQPAGGAPAGGASPPPATTTPPPAQATAPAPASTISK